MFRSCPSAGHLLSLSSVASHLTLQSLATLGCDRPMTYCMPHGVPDAMTVAGLPFKTLQMPGGRFFCSRNSTTTGRFTPTDGSCRLVRTPRGSVLSCLANRYADGRFYRASCLPCGPRSRREGVAFPPTNRVAIPLLWTWPPPVMAIAVVKFASNRRFRFKGSLTASTGGVAATGYCCAF
jgi:hypothetical protein